MFYLGSSRLSAFVALHLTVAVTLTRLINGLLWALQPYGSYRALSTINQYYVVYLNNTCTGQPYLLIKDNHSPLPELIPQPRPSHTLMRTLSAQTTFYILAAGAPTAQYTEGQPLSISGNASCEDISTWGFPSQTVTALTTQAPPTNTSSITFIFPPHLKAS